MALTSPVSAPLAEFAAQVQFDAAPPPAQHAARRTFLNVVALATAAARRPSVAMVLELHRSLETPPHLSLLGRDEKAGLFAAPLVNGMAMHVDDYDDTHLPTIVHPGAPVVPAALAAAELCGADGTRTMSGVLAGVEVALRVADGICPEHLERGWHPTGTCGHLGAAVAAARILSLDPEQTLAALAIATVQAAGLLTVNGTMTKAFHPGKAAANGLEAALLAQRGMTGPRDPIEAPLGFARATSPKVDYERMVSGLGSRWEIEKNAIKPYACGIVSHAAIDAAIALRTQVRPDEVAAIEARVPRIVLTAMGIPEPRDALETKFSVYHCITVGLLDGDGGPPQFSDDRAVAADVVSLRRRVRTIVDDRMPVGAVELQLTTTDGRHLTETVRHATASAERPMTDEQLETKARRLLEAVTDVERSDEVIRQAWRLADSGRDGVARLFEVTAIRDREEVRHGT